MDVDEAMVTGEVNVLRNYAFSMWHNPKEASRPLMLNTYTVP